MGYTIPGIPLFPQPINQCTAVRQQTCQPGIADLDRLKYHSDIDMLAKSYFTYAAPLVLDTVHFVDLYKAQKDPLFHTLTLEHEANLLAFLALLCKDTAIADTRWAAYMMATVCLESRVPTKKGWIETWAPTSEIRPKADAGSYWNPVLVTDAYGKVDKNHQPIGHPIDAAGNVIDVKHDKNAAAKEIHNAYYGRGYCQLTWAENYGNMDKNLNLSGRLYIQPDTTLDMTVAYRVLSYGMVNGSFSHGHQLSTFIGAKADYYNARKIINPNELAKHPEVARKGETYANAFEDMLQHSRLDFLLMAKQRQSIGPTYIRDHPELLDPPSSRPF